MGQNVGEQTVLHRSMKLKQIYTQKLLIVERTQENFQPIGFVLMPEKKFITKQNENSGRWGNKQFQASIG